MQRERLPFHYVVSLFSVICVLLTIMFAWGGYWIYQFATALAAIVAYPILLPRVLLIGTILFVCSTAVAWWAVALTVKRQYYKTRLELLAHYDRITELPNRTLFFDRLEHLHVHVTRYQRYYGLVVLDLDGVAAMSERLGHHASDELLHRVARILMHSLRRSDTVARLDTYEFAVLLTEIRNPNDALLLGQKIVAALNAPIRLSMGEVEIIASGGVVVFPDHSRHANELFQLAYQTMLQAKRSDGHRCLGAMPWPVMDAPE